MIKKGISKFIPEDEIQAESEKAEYILNQIELILKFKKLLTDQEQSTLPSNSVKRNNSISRSLSVRKDLSAESPNRAEQKSLTLKLHQVDIVDD